MSHTHNTPPSNFSTADLPTDMAEGSVAFDTDTQELVAYKKRIVGISRQWVVEQHPPLT